MPPVVSQVPVAPHPVGDGLLESVFKRLDRFDIKVDSLEKKLDQAEDARISTNNNMRTLQSSIVDLTEAVGRVRIIEETLKLLKDKLNHYDEKFAFISEKFQSIDDIKKMLWAVLGGVGSIFTWIASNSLPQWIISLLQNINH